MNYKEAINVHLEVFNKCNPEEKELPTKKTVTYLMMKHSLQTLKLNFTIRKRN